jgi:signal transduction histidine kinase
MFEPYTRLGHPHRAQGLGLGLYLAREIVKAHGGEIDVSSRMGRGTVMTVRLPVVPARKQRGRIVPATPASGTKSSSRPA